MLTCGRVADGHASTIAGENEEAVARRLRIKGIFKAGGRLDIAAGGSSVIEGEDVFMAGAAVFGCGDDGEARLAIVVGLEEGAV
jgi:hypothetical protein